MSAQKSAGVSKKGKYGERLAVAKSGELASLDSGEGADGVKEIVEAIEGIVDGTGEIGEEIGEGIGGVIPEEGKV